MMTRIVARNSKRSWLQWLCAIALIIAPSSWVRAGDELPSGAEVLDTYVKNTGGKSAYKRVKNRVMKVSANSPQGSIMMTMYHAAPNKMLVEVETPMGSMTSGTDGDVAWRLTPMGPQVLEGKERNQQMREANIQSTVNWRKFFKEAVCKEITDFQDEKCYKVTLTSNGDDEETRYYAVDTGLLVGREQSIAGPMGEMQITTKVTDYSEVDGILYPHKLVQMMGGNEMGTLEFASIEHNVEIPSDKFALPAEIVEHIKDMKEAGDIDAPESAEKKKG